MLGEAGLSFKKLLRNTFTYIEEISEKVLGISWDEKFVLKLPCWNSFSFLLCFFSFFIQYRLYLIFCQKNKKNKKK